MIFFGAPLATDDRDHALRSVRMGLEMQERMGILQEKWVRAGVPPFEIRIGINTGQATIGNFGSKGRVDYTAIGRQVNLAARLQAVIARPWWRDAVGRPSADDGGRVSPTSQG